MEWSIIFLAVILSFQGFGCIYNEPRYRIGGKKKKLEAVLKIDH